MWCQSESSQTSLHEPRASPRTSVFEAEASAACEVGTCHAGNTRRQPSVAANTARLAQGTALSALFFFAWSCLIVPGHSDSFRRSLTCVARGQCVKAAQRSVRLSWLPETQKQDCQALRLDRLGRTCFQAFWPGGQRAGGPFHPKKADEACRICGRLLDGQDFASPLREELKELEACYSGAVYC